MEPTVNARLMTQEQILALRVNRESEVDSCSDLLRSTTSNVFIFGPRGVGKTFLVRLIHAKLRKNAPEVFPFFLNATELAVFGAKGTGEAFPAMLLLQLISSIWREILQHSYSELLRTAETQKRAIKIEKRAQVCLQRIFLQLRYPDFTVTQENASEFSVSAIAKGGLSENLNIERKSVGILPYEFMEYLEELKSVVLPKVGISKLVGIIDEANMMPVEWQEAVVSRHIDIFSNRGMQFVLVAGFVPSLKTADIPRNFESVLELHGLRLTDVPRLLEVHFGERVKCFDRESIALLHNETAGNPREVVTLAERSLRRIEPEGSQGGRGVVESAIQEHKEMIQRLTKGLS